MRAANAIDVSYDTTEITTAMEKCLFDEDFRTLSRTVENPYGSGNVGQQIADVLLKTELGSKLLLKKMVTKGKEKDGWFS